MTVSKKSMAVVCLLAFSLAAARNVVGTPQAPGSKSPPNEKKASGNADRTGTDRRGTGVELAILSVSADNQDDIRLQVAFKNESQKDIVLNLGMMLANGKVHLPDAIRLTLTDKSNKTRQLHFSDRKYPGVAGRVDDYLVPLRKGSTYTLKLSLKNFWSPKTQEFSLNLVPGKYTLRAKFTGKTPQYVNADTAGLELISIWTGSLKSTAAQFQIGNPK
jgi:hypothetical protein